MVLCEPYFHKVGRLEEICFPAPSNAQMQPSIGPSYISPVYLENFTIGTLFPYTNPATLESSCYSNLRVCPWNLSNDLREQDGNEFEQANRCSFAWANLCTSGQGFNVNASQFGAAENHYPCFMEYQSLNHAALIYSQCLNKCKGIPDVLLQNMKSGAVIAQVTSSSLYSPRPGFWYPLGAYDDSGSSFEKVLCLAYYSIYDILNVPSEVLEARSTATNSTQCIEWPQVRDSYGELTSTPGWGGAGYLTSATGCKRYPASYLGAGLYFNKELCGPKPTLSPNLGWHKG